MFNKLGQDKSLERKYKGYTIVALHKEINVGYILHKPNGEKIRWNFTSLKACKEFINYELNHKA